jgi:hypothetical protein
MLDLRSVTVWLKSHFEDHVKVCYLTYFILSYLSYILERNEKSGSEAIDTMKTCYRVYLEDQKN